MMTLREGKGKVPIWMIDSPTPYLLVDFPTREVFNYLFDNWQINDQIRDKYWNILNLRLNGASLADAGKPYSISRERVRQIEAKFMSKFSWHLMTTNTFGKTN